MFFHNQRFLLSFVLYSPLMLFRGSLSCEVSAGYLFIYLLSFWKQSTCIYCVHTIIYSSIVLQSIYMFKQFCHDCPFLSLLKILLGNTHNNSKRYFANFFSEHANSFFRLYASFPSRKFVHANFESVCLGLFYRAIEWIIDWKVAGLVFHLPSKSSKSCWFRRHIAMSVFISQWRCLFVVVSFHQCNYICCLLSFVYTINLRHCEEMKKTLFNRFVIETKTSTRISSVQIIDVKTSPNFHTYYQTLSSIIMRFPNALI